MLKTFTGFKGTAAKVQIGDIEFAILASSPTQLELLWNSILTQAGPFDAAMCKKAILIEASLLPDKFAKTPDGALPPAMNNPTIDV